MRGYFGIGIMHSKREENIGTLFRSAHSFGADFIFTVGRRYSKQASDTTKAFKHVPLFHFKSIGDLQGHLPFGCCLVGVELTDDSTALPMYDHPLRACYLLGAEDHGLTKDALSWCHDVVEVPGAKHCLNVSVAGSIVLYDRVIKMAQRKAAAS